MAGFEEALEDPRVLEDIEETTSTDGSCWWNQPAKLELEEAGTAGEEHGVGGQGHRHARRLELSNLSGCRAALLLASLP